MDPYVTGDVFLEGVTSISSADEDNVREVLASLAGDNCGSGGSVYQPSTGSYISTPYGPCDESKVSFTQSIVTQGMLRLSFKLIPGGNLDAVTKTFNHLVNTTVMDGASVYSPGLSNFTARVVAKGGGLSSVTSAWGRYKSYMMHVCQWNNGIVTCTM